MGDDLAELTEIVKRRYETGEYGHAHLKVTPTILDEMRRRTPPPDPDAYIRRILYGGPLGDLMSIPVVVDDELPPGTWRLVDNSTGETLRAGTVLAIPDEETTDG